MPVEEDYGRRQITHASQSPVPPSLQCPVGCIPSDHRYASDKNLLDPTDRYSDRFGSERSNSDRLPSGERYQGVSERYPLGERPQTSVSSERLQPTEERTQFHHYATCQRYPERYTPGSLDRYHTHTIDRYSRTSTPTDRYHDKDKTSERYQGENFSANDRHNSTQNVCYTPTERHRSKSSDMYKIRERSASSERNRFQNRYEQYLPERFPAIPCPERFATQDRVPYMEPPSPAPGGDRFVPPPQSPGNTPSPDYYPNNAFPSPTNTAPPPERFIPPPPLSPSPTEKYSPKKIRYDRYHHRNQYYPPNDRYVNPSDRFVSTDRYIPPNAHMPVERYVPQQQEPYYNYQSFERYPKFNANDPYMRRDLAFHYRLPIPYSSTQYQRVRYSHMGTPNRVKCCQYQDGYQLSKSSPGSSSSSSVTSQGQKEVQCVNNSSLQEMQCQSYQTCAYQQEKGTQCGKECVGFVSPNLRKGQCRHSICASPSVEYVGASGGRHVCATPPPRGSIGSADGAVCNDNCCTTRRAQNSLTVAVWRAAAPSSQPVAPQQQQQQPSQPSPPQQRTTTPVPEDASTSEPKQSEPPELRHPQHSPPSVKAPPVQRAVSLPATSLPERSRIQNRLGYTQSERLPNRPPLNRSFSRKEMIKNYIKKETATFFGVDEESEEKQQRRWLDRRIRMASRTYGPLKDEYRTLGSTYRRTMSEIAPGRMSGQLQAERPDVLPGPNDVVDAGQERLHEVTVRRKDSVARMTWDGLSYVVNTLTRHRPRRRSQQSQVSRSFPPDTPYSSSSVEEEAFFQKPTSPTSPRPQEEGDSIDRRGHEPTLQPAYRDRLTVRPGSGGWRRDPHVVLRHEGQNRPTVGGSRVFSSLLDNVLDNSNRRQYGMGWVGRMFGRSMRNSVTQDDKILQQLDDMEDHRPMFTYWVTTVQILVLFISLICYGWGPFGIDMYSRSGQVLVTSLSLQQVDYLEPANFWFGPKAGDLIHLGAKFAPCMRIDDKISQQIDKIRAKERETACCIRNDDSGCVQSSQADCSKTISKWKKWSAGEAGPGGRISGSVCGLDPKFCDAPASVHPYEWPDDITKWPICRKTNTQFSIQKGSGSRDKSAEHMVCEVIGHPCCIGIHGQCKITTKEYCDFVQGAFHEEASLCSQVSCLNDVCGMLPFYFAETPDQFYRLWTSLFLHAGVLQLAVTVLIQYFLMRDLEKLTGSLRIGIIYIGSGVAGNLASAIFVPYRADVGPAGSQFGLLACLIVEVLNSWPMLKHPNQALCKLLSITLVLFLIGLLPWVDNYAHLFGFVFGFLLSYALLPFISFGIYERRKKIVLIWVCLASAGVLFICLVLLFYIIPVYDCKICSYFNCIPFTRDFCASQNINFKREEPIV